MPKLKWPVWHYHAHIQVLASTWTNLLSNKNTGYEWSTRLSSSWPVWVRAVFGKYRLLEIWRQSCRRFLGSWKQPVIRPSMPWACRRKRCLRGYPLQDRFPWIVFTYSFYSSILMFFWWPPVRLACLGHAVRKEVASKTPYQDRDGAIPPFFLFFFCFLFEYLPVVSIVHVLESSMTGVLPSKRRKIFGKAMWKFSKFVVFAWLLKIFDSCLNRLWRTQTGWSFIPSVFVW